MSLLEQLVADVKAYGDDAQRDGMDAWDNQDQEALYEAFGRMEASTYVLALVRRLRGSQGQQ